MIAHEGGGSQRELAVAMAKPLVGR